MATLLVQAVLCAVAATHSAVQAGQWQLLERPGPPVVVFSGTVDAGDTERLARLVSDHGLTPGFRVHLESRGGDVDEAMRLGRYLRRQQVVATHGRCASSCAFAFVGAVHRYTQPAASRSDSQGLVVHQPSAAIGYPNVSPFAQRALPTLERYLTDMTGRPHFYAMMIQVPFSRPVALSTQEALDMGVVTALLR